MKVGRNEPCPCGSGKKYKQCCLAKEIEAGNSSAEMAWRRIRRALEGSAELLLNFTGRTYGSVSVVEAWSEFAGETALPFDPKSPHAALFYSWWFYKWTPDSADSGVADRSLKDTPPAAALLHRRGKQMDTLLRRYMEAALKAPITFYEVIGSSPGTGMLLREFFTDEEYNVSEAIASASLQPGAIIFAQLVPIDGVVLIDGMAGYALQPAHKVELIKLRESFQIGKSKDRSDLNDYCFEFIDCYLSIAEGMTVRPQLRNTDGDPLEPQTLVFDIDSAEGAFAALHDLFFESTESEQRAVAKFGEDGTVQSAEIPWLDRDKKSKSDGPSTVLGRILISGERMRIEVNSDFRAGRIRAIVEQRMGRAARYRLSERQSMQRMLDDAQLEGNDAGSSPDEELRSNPKFQEHIQRVLRAHYDTWPDTPLPALDGKTPKQAMKTKVGREKVEALVDGIEHNPDAKMQLDPGIIARLREQLGLK